MKGNEREFGDSAFNVVGSSVLIFCFFKFMILIDFLSTFLMKIIPTFTKLTGMNMYASILKSGEY